LWEFVPYNDAELRPRVDQLFLTQVTWIVRRLLRRRPHRGLALALLKRLYDRQFGDDPHPRNLASLFLYSGPVGVRIGMRQHIATHAVRWNAARDNFAQLATGDGYLDSPARLAALRHFFGSTRIKRAGIVQVMHHGASANWHEGVAAALAPAVSIFSSDPAHKGYRHPHPEVLRDFWPWCPVQVDRERGFELVVWLT
ncbi:MAG TPA: hypothetical protein VK533_02260, partial [Sphingomonas sp.]|uniref:hypothetical protein n=1 Tax=Sphingomonas sp. TaxID=28214 RepID=UPI002CDF6A45